jgi:group II intron reverse transcriptase/maturase
VNWILDADIRGFFDHLSHEWMMKFVEHRVADTRILRLIRKWLKAGVSEEGRWHETTAGTPQGAVISPLLANVYLHYAFDLWVEAWRRKIASGDMIFVRYADDLVVGFEQREDAERFLREFQERLAGFALELHPEKTRLIEFGRFAQVNRQQRGEGKPEAFTFLGFTHYCSTDTKGHFAVRRRTVPQRMRTTLHAIKAKLRQRMHEPVNAVGVWLKRVVSGYYRYHALPDNQRALWRFRDRLCDLWRSMLGRRSQRSRPSWKRIRPTFERWIPRPEILHPYPGVLFDATHPR